MEQASLYTDRFMEWIRVFGLKILGAILVFVIGIYLINLVGKLITRTMRKKSVDDSLQSFLKSMVSVALKILLLVTIAGMLGIQTTSFVAVIGALGLAVGLALQGSLANFAGGVLLMVFKPFKVGDLIESGGQTGFVQEIQIFNTVLLTPENKTVILANGGVSNGTIINYTRHGNLRVDITMAVALDSDIEKARRVALETMAASSLVLKDPAPSFNILKIGDGMITLAVRPYATPDNYWGVYFGVQEDLRAAFAANNIAGPIPTMITIKK